MKIFLHGFATTPEIWPEGGPRLSFDDLEKTAEGLGSRLGPGNILIGWSMGGMVAMMVAAKYPEKVAKLVLVSTTTKFVASPDFPHGLSPALLRSLRKRIKKEGIKAFHSLVFKNMSRVGLADLTTEQAERELAELEKVDLRPWLKDIRVPTLIIHGEKDDICLPSAAQYLNDKIEGSELVMLSGVGHAPMVEAPEVFNSLLKNYAG